MTMQDDAMKPRLAMIAAVAENGVIGRDNDMPWRLRSDMQFFKATTMGKPVIMGRKTFDSLGGRLLPKRPNLIVTRDRTFSFPGAHVFHSLEAAIAAAGGAGLNPDQDEVMIMGGGMLYKEAMPQADRLYITLVHATPEGDTYFPALDGDQWSLVSSDFMEAGEHDSADMTFEIYDRVSA